MWAFNFLLYCVNVFMKICCVNYVTFIDFVGSLGTLSYTFTINCRRDTG